ncbi:hypothetical protein [Campylobacter blaseri]|uniref:Uncharacterized protein n=1 Tax=Campylobacter blaseri TaxID=2042961 RepID=A0A2P8R3H4_9BACT|nr:hypothetical protein [Campylobacter blaseri]PSM53046.1 hypothetical protein CQ405_00380 [Campylobacter blaseri]PSM54513.1 hypothetical protein CRN67_00380 [Campylobacter blaseri]
MVLDNYQNKSEIILKGISKCENINMKIRENILDKQKILSVMLKLPKFDEDLKDKFKIMGRRL